MANGTAVSVEGVEEVQTLLKEMPSFLYDGAKKAYDDTLLRAHKAVSANFNTSGAAISSNKLTSRTGLLAKSIKTRVVGATLKSLSGSIYTDVIYAPVQEGKNGLLTIIKAKDKYSGVPGGPYLNIPLSANLTPAGVMRQSAQEVFATGGYIVQSKKGNWLVMSGSGKPMFVLKKQVSIPARLGMVKAAESQVPYLLDQLRNVCLE